eukprot:499974-Pyramimonas_sp.AAC.2
MFTAMTSGVLHGICYNIPPSQLGSVTTKYARRGSMLVPRYDVDVRGGGVDVRGYGVNVRGYGVNVGGGGVDVTDCDVDVRAYDVDVRGGGVDVRGCGVDVRGYDVDVRGCGVADFGGYGVDVRGYGAKHVCALRRQAIKIRTTERQETCAHSYGCTDFTLAVISSTSEARDLIISKSSVSVATLPSHQYIDSTPEHISERERQSD